MEGSGGGGGKTSCGGVGIVQLHLKLCVVE